MMEDTLLSCGFLVNSLEMEELTEEEEGVALLEYLHNGCSRVVGASDGGAE